MKILPRDFLSIPGRSHIQLATYLTTFRHIEVTRGGKIIPGHYDYMYHEWYYKHPSSSSMMMVKYGIIKYV